MSSEGDMVLKAQGIQKTYQQFSNTLSVLKNVQLEVRAGECVAVVGPSGAGKSTLMHILGGLDQPDKGKVLVDGQDVYALNDRNRSRLRNTRIGFIFQFYHLLPEFTALENVMLPGIIARERQTKLVEQRAHSLLKRVGLEGRLTHKPYQLSGGEQQRVAIARALINEPALVLCDEPTGNLDSATGREVIDLLKEVNRVKHQTLMIVTHDENIAEQAHRVIHMRDGQLMEEGVKVS